MTRAQIYNGRARIKDGRARVGPDDECCCAEEAPPVPEDCNDFILQRARACAEDWLADFPAEGDHAAFVTSLASTQVDVTLPTGFGVNSPTTCGAGVCEALDGATFTLPNIGGPIWRLVIADYCGVSDLILVFSISCNTATDVCDLQLTMVIDGLINPIWKKVSGDQIEFATLNESLPRFNSSTGVGGGTCTLTNITDPATVAIH